MEISYVLGLLLWLCIALPLLGVMYALYFILRREKLMRESLIAKCGGTFIPLATISIGILAGNGSAGNLGFAFCFVLLCMAADALLEIKFELGMALFAFAHILFMIYIAGISSLSVWSFPVWILAYAALLLIFKKDLAVQGKLKVPFLLYAAVLTGVFALASPMFLSGSKRLILTALGSLVFLVSDCFVAKFVMSVKKEWVQKTAMVLYWGSLMITASSVWL